MNKGIAFLIRASVIAAVYAVLTIIFAPISFGVIQLRVSEALCVLPAFTLAAVPGLFVGCLVANIIGGAPLIDIILGSLATLLAAYLSRLLRKRRWLVPLPAVAVNAAVVGVMLSVLYAVPVFASMGYVALGQIGACYVIGIPLMYLLERYNGKWLD